MSSPFPVSLLRFRAHVSRLLRIRQFHSTLLWAAVIGFLAAWSSLAFRGLIRLAQHGLTGHEGHIVEVAMALTPAVRIIVPTLGGLLAGLARHLGSRLLPARAPDYLEAIVVGDGVIPVRASIVRAFSSLMSIASGSSIGREGAIVQIAATTASGVGRRLSLSPQRLRLLTACGAAAGIAAAYNAPLAGAVFVAEIVFGAISMDTFGVVVFSSVVATVTLRLVSNVGPEFQAGPFHVTSGWELPVYLALGVVAGVLAPLFLRLLRASHVVFALLRLPVYLRLALGGLVVGIVSVLEPRVWGNGYGVIDSLLHSPWAFRAVLFMLVLKLVATAASTGSGAIGGVFTPTLFVGAALGMIFGIPVHQLWPATTAPAQAYAIVGMGAFLAATTHAPIMAMLVVFEMSLDYDILPPLMLACVVAFYAARAIDPRSIYAEALAARQPHRSSSHLPPVVTAADIMRVHTSTVRSDATPAEAARVFSRHPDDELFVIDDAGHFLGAISLQSADGLARSIAMLSLLDPDHPRVPREEPLSSVIDTFTRAACDRIAVIKSVQDPLLVGSISRGDVTDAVVHYLGESAPRR